MSRYRSAFQFFFDHGITRTWGEPLHVVGEVQS